MKYELLIRQVYQCERDSSNGADAGIYRAMERAFADLESKVIYSTKIEQEHEFKKRIAIVRNYVRKSIIDGIKQIDDSVAPNVISELESKQEILTTSFCDKVTLDEIIERVSELFHTNGLVI